MGTVGPTQHPAFFFFSIFFGMANSMINPLIYGAFHSCRCGTSTPVSGAAAVAAPRAR